MSAAFTLRPVGEADFEPLLDLSIRVLRADLERVVRFDPERRRTRMRAGFDPATLGHGGHGLAGMRQRIEALGGQWQVQSAPGQGTRFELVFPLRERAEAAAGLQALSAAASAGASLAAGATSTTGSGGFGRRSMR